MARHDVIGFVATRGLVDGTCSSSNGPRFSFGFNLLRFVNCVDSPPSSLNCVRSVSRDPPIPIMTVLPRNELMSLSGQSTTAPASGGRAEPLEKRPSAGLGERSEKTVNGIGPTFCSTSCDHACASTQPEHFQHGNRPTNEYVLVSIAACNDPFVGAVLRVPHTVKLDSQRRTWHLSLF